MHAQIASSLRNYDTAHTDQPYGLELELATGLLSLHRGFPIGESNHPSVSNKTQQGNMRRLNPALDHDRSRASLARFGFRTIGSNRLVDQLSGCECLQAGLACVLSTDPEPQLLMLDEPTNHPGVESIEVIEEARREFDVAVMVISHDEAFLDAIGVGHSISL